MHGLAAALSLLFLVLTSLSVLPSAARAAAAVGADVVRVGTFNVRSVRAPEFWAPNERPWGERRGAVIRDILSQDLHVVCLQEASPSTEYPRQLVHGDNQYLDLRNGLNRAGASFALTNADPDASSGTRILFDTRSLRLVRSGEHAYRLQTEEGKGRHIVWAVLEVRATGTRFFVANTHLGLRETAIQAQQWDELREQVNALSDGLPVIVGGDFQRNRLSQPTAEKIVALKAAGYGDVVGQQAMVKELRDPRPDAMVRGWIDSTNGFDRDVTKHAYETHRDFPGASADWIFASNDLHIRRWTVVVHLDMDRLKLVGTIPSDHNLLVAAVALGG